MSKVLNKFNLKENAKYCFVVKDKGSVEGVFLKEEGSEFLLKTENGFNILPKEKVYFFYKQGSRVS